jgi:four helix bundle protein
MLDEGAHGTLSCVVRYQEHTAVNASRSMAISKPARTFQDLLVWQKPHQFVLGVYALAAAFPKQETYGLSLQMRRAAVSIPANIAEGFRRRGKADKARFMNIADGSVEECRYFPILVKDHGYGDIEGLASSLGEVSRLLNAYTAAILAFEFLDSHIPQGYQSEASAIWSGRRDLNSGPLAPQARDINHLQTTLTENKRLVVV